MKLGVLGSPAGWDACPLQVIPHHCQFTITTCINIFNGKRHWELNVSYKTHQPLGQHASRYQKTLYQMKTQWKPNYLCTKLTWTQNYLYSCNYISVSGKSFFKSNIQCPCSTACITYLLSWVNILFHKCLHLVIQHLSFQRWLEDVTTCR